MQRISKTLASAAIATALFATSGGVLADQPTVTILQPTGTVYLNAFPAVVPVGFQVNANGVTSQGRLYELHDLNVLEVKVDGLSIIGDSIGSPFHLGGQGGPFNSCDNVLANAAFTACNVDTATQATVGLNWTVPAAGTYSLLVSAKHTGDTGLDEETVTFLTLNVEYPAPPAVANAYLNANNPPKSKVRGCIISAIAELHAKDSAYGPKGGPYDNELIIEDVLEFRADCGG